ncbi:MAG TPA: dTDP-4-dehydrorhamnose 3,5-epimerase [Flavisolibacter sp.]|jgi:dTDP-4-dehydrorhamnose 3,5-epimerase|nr:dTDP-4-dehydrorhamnose 3,5-epimerase [Flavisolibacter sp.]
MIFTETKLKGAYIIDVKRLEDERGFFGRSFCQREFEAFGLNTNAVQANVSFNTTKGTLRGMHMQVQPYGETKLVRCTRGAIYDVIVDLRPDSPTFKQWIGVELTAETYRMLFVPEGFAHGFLTLEDNTDVTYQVTQFYTPIAERGFRWDDPAFNIQWPYPPTLVSPKDQAHAPFEISALTLLEVPAAL